VQPYQPALVVDDAQLPVVRRPPHPILNIAVSACDQLACRKNDHLNILVCCHSRANRRKQQLLAGPYESHQSHHTRGRRTYTAPSKQTANPSFLPAAPKRTDVILCSSGSNADPGHAASGAVGIRAVLMHTGGRKSSSVAMRP